MDQATFQEFMEFEMRPENARRGGEIAFELMPVLAEMLKSSDGETAEAIASALDRCGGFFTLLSGLHANEQLAALALEAFDLSLEVTRESAPLEWATTQMNRASAMQNLGERQVGEASQVSLRDAVAGYDHSLGVFTKEDTPNQWSVSQMNRANALLTQGRRLGGEVGLARLRDAIAGYDQSLAVSLSASTPRQRALSHMNRASALSLLGGRLSGEAAFVSLRDAVADYDRCLELLTPKKDPHHWAMSHMNRANLLLMLAKHESGEAGLATLREALAGHERSLEVRGRENTPYDWAISHMNRANVLQNLGERLDGKAGLASLHDAVASYDLSLEVLTRENASFDWAGLHMNRGNVLQRLGERLGSEAGLDRLREAVDGYELSLEVTTRENSPIQWATSQMNRAIALQKLGERLGGKAGVASLCAAVETYRDAASAFREWGDATGEATARRRIIEPALLAEDWDCVATAGAALEERAPAALLSASTDRDRKEVFELVRGASDAHAYALSKLGRFEDAVSAAESGRARALRDQIRQRLAKLTLEQEAELAELRDQREQAQHAFRSLDASAPPNLRSDYLDALQRAHWHFTECLERNGLGVEPVSSDLWKGLAPQNGFVVQICVTQIGAVAFVLPAGTSELDERHVVYLNDLTSESVENLFANEINEGWLDVYTAFRNDLQQSENRSTVKGLRDWNSCIERLLGELSSLVMEPLSEKLRALGGCKDAPVVLVTPGLLANLPIHAAGERIDGAWQCFLDDWTPSYAPSLSVLANLNRHKAMQGNTLLAITDPEEDFGNPANPAVAHFDQPIELAGPEGSIETVLQALSHADYACFLCHGIWDPQDSDQSGLALADGRLTVSELRRAELPRAPIIALGACETTLVSMDAASDEMNGLPAALIQAGARGVASTFWPVFGHAADAILDGFFERHMAAGLSPPEAMRASILKMRDGGATSEPLAKAACRSSFRAFSDGTDAPANAGAREAILRDFALPIHWAAYGYFGKEMST